jgi:tetratricopeptide (TPR) repeat protein
MDTLGSVYCTLCLVDKAEPLLQRALTLRREHLPNDHPDLAGSLHTLAWLHHQKGDYTKAQALYRDALAIRRQHSESAPMALSATLFSLAWLLADLEDFVSSRQMFEEVVELRRRHLGADHRSLAFAQMGLAFVHICDKNFPAAVEPHRQGMETLRRLDGDHGLCRSMELLQLGLFAREVPRIARPLLGLGALQDPIRCFKESVKLAKPVLGNDHPYVGVIYHELAATLSADHKDEEAERYFRDCLRIVRRYGWGHPKASFPLLGLCRLLQRRGRRAEAEQLVQDALEARRTCYGPNHYVVADTLAIYAGLLDGPSESSRRVEMFRQALAIYCETPSPAGRVFVSCFNRLIAWLDPNQLYDAARALARSTAHRGEGDTGHPSYADLAMTALRQAKSKGLKDVQPLRVDKDLNALRARQDFRELLHEMEAAARK